MIELPSLPPIEEADYQALKFLSVKSEKELDEFLKDIIIWYIEENRIQ